MNKSRNNFRTIASPAVSLAVGVMLCVSSSLPSTALCDMIYWDTTCTHPMRWLESVNNWTPARFPGTSDTAVLGKSGTTPVDVCLASGDSVTISNASVACAASTTAKITVNSGASLTFDSVAATTWFGNASSASSELDIDGGSVAINGVAWFSDAGTGNTIRVRNGGTLDLGEKVVFGKDKWDYNGPTRLFVTDGGTVRQSATGELCLGHGDRGINGGAGGEITVDGGTLVAGNEIYANCAYSGGYMGRAIVRLLSGDISFSGTKKHLAFWSGATHAFIQSGGTFNGNLSFQGGVYSTGDMLVEISGGTNTCSFWLFGTESGTTTGRMHMRIVGRKGVVKVGKAQFHTGYSNSAFTEPPIFMEFVVDPSTRRDSTYPVTPVYVTKNRYDGGYAEICGVHHVRPAGGAQLVHQNYFPMYVKAHDGWINNNGYNQVESTDSDHGFRRYRYGADDQFQTIGEEMWTNSFEVVQKNEVLGTNGYTWQFRQKLRAQAALVSGAAALETPVVRGFLSLPSLSSRDVSEMKKARVRLAITPGDGETLQSIVEGFKANGYPDSKVEADGIYNVSFVIPVERLATGISTDKILFDFAEYRNFNAAKNKSPTIRARISAVKWDPKIGEDATVMVMR